MHILVINSGSSSIKFSIYAGGPAAEGRQPCAQFEGEISGIGGAAQSLSLHRADGREVPGGTPKTDPRADPMAILEEAVCAPGMPEIEAVGYRVVHPGAVLDRHQRITEDVLKELERAVEFAPLHDPEAIRLIRDVMERFPMARHYACFDTVFHQTMPPVASTYPIPVVYRDRGVRRYGFHGLSCESVVDELRTATDAGKVEFPQRMVIAHLGSGCSVTALMDGKSLDTSMGLTPTGGVVMGTRPGDLDPGLILYLLRQAEGDRTAALQSVESLLNHKAGMVALSGLPNDMRAVRQAEADSEAARLAVEVFTRSVRKAIGAFAWLLGGLDAIVFTGGIGEHDTKSRTEILAGLESCGVLLGTDLQDVGMGEVRRASRADSQVTVWVIPAQEDRMIAVHVGRMEAAGNV